LTHFLPLLQWAVLDLSYRHAFTTICSASPVSSRRAAAASAGTSTRLGYHGHGHDPPAD
jgi:hypothetical protein